jgi:serine/threonine-protein kinase
MDALFLSFQEALAGRYSLERELGRGGMGVVYLAREVRLDRPVAIKLLPPELAAHTTLKERFIREARTAARLSHPYIIPIHSVDELGGFVFYVMAYVDGETLADRVRARGPLPPNTVTRIMREVAWALAYAHAQQVVHRDIKPANIMLERGTERALVMDFGIARAATSETTGADSSLALGMTGPNEVMGTPEYMSPEQACGEAVDGRSDLYSLGIVGWFALTGTLPFTGGAREVLAQQVTVVPPPVSTVAAGATRALATAIDTCLAKDPAKRFATGEQLADALAQSLEKKDDVPVPLRVFLDPRRNIPVMAVPVAGMFMIGGSVIPMLVAGSGAIGANLTAFGTAGAAAFVMVAAPFVLLVARLRRVLRQGYGIDDIVAAARQLQERQREEFLYEFGTTPSARERMFRFVRVAGASVAAIGVSGMILLKQPGANSILGPMAMLGLYGFALGSIVSAKWRRLRKGKEPRLAKIWGSRIGRGMARLASINLGTRAIPADRPTELGIAMSAEALFDGFNKELKKSLGDVPSVLRGLESHARAMRTRMTELDASIQDAQRGTGSARAAGASAVQDKLVEDLKAARAQAEARLAEVVSAMETLRLGLLRLHAGAGSAESVTQDLAAAKALGDDVDRLLVGHGEVENVLRKDSDNGF